MTKFDMTFKILMLGNASVGKTSLSERYITGVFNPDLRLTVGVEFFIKTIEINGKTIKLQIWDMGGEERFRFLLPTYSLGTSGAIFMYDITNMASLEAHQSWTSIVREKNGNIPIILVGNKVDLESKRAVPRETGIEVAKKAGLSGFVEVSAKEGINVEKTFEILTELMTKNMDSNETGRVELKQIESQKKESKETESKVVEKKTIKPNPKPKSELFVPKEPYFPDSEKKKKRGK